MNNAPPPHPIIHWIGVLATAIPYFALAWVLFRVWGDPMNVDDGNWVRYGVGLLLLEFVLLHSGAFTGGLMATLEDRTKRVAAFGGLLLFYALMAWGMSVAVDSPMLLWVFAGVTSGRLIAVIAASVEGRTIMMIRSAIGILCYLGFVFASVMAPIPEWGITPEIVSDVYPGRGEGVWEQEPHRAIAAAAGYFAVLGLTELLLIGPGQRIWQSRQRR